MTTVKPNNDNKHDKENNKDTIYSEPLGKVADFVFDKSVVNVFPDMIKRSVPGYSTIVHMIGQFAERYNQSGSKCYDLGCSLGAATLAMRHRITAADTHIVAVDNSADMVERCRQVIDADSAEVPVELIHDDILKVEITNASVCVLNFTLQFIPLKQRQQLLTKIYQGMLPGGILIISEKLKFSNNHHNELMTEFHHYFKKTNGYSDMEIAQKRNAIENVLIPESFDVHRQRLEDIGFKNTELWFQCFNFSSFITFKQ
ncbi:carboxy-S-adenosyl-L-methionine synthase CmoA [Agarilytica rhodophyticola]|uniref:carboxy-S-adenosyl-L-methionine synthase CmoA n=1 Tax=Agarilytica rhodophyticola TaxID=1737490 RepID=UPI000B342EF4|nr:carboxy-S-adenosyl-L-methionine synthase CmoA [Agarilytica rhodophyticola]